MVIVQFLRSMKTSKESDISALIDPQEERMHEPVGVNVSDVGLASHQVKG